MNAEKTNAEIAFLEDLYALPDERLVLMSNETAAVPECAGVYGRISWLSLWDHLRRLSDSWQW